MAQRGHRRLGHQVLARLHSIWYHPVNTCHQVKRRHSGPARHQECRFRNRHPTTDDRTPVTFLEAFRRLRNSAGFPQGRRMAATPLTWGVVDHLALVLVLDLDLGGELRR